MSRSKRAAVAAETVEIAECGRYTADDGSNVRLGDEVAAAKRSTVLYDVDEMPARPQPRFESGVQVEVTGESTFAAIARIATEEDGHIGCLNFASAKNPGGGFLGGSQAQEEALARASALYPCLQTQFSGYYEANRRSHSCLYLDLAIVSPLVPFFRDDDDTLLSKPLLVTVITSPAPNAGAIAKNEPENRSRVESTLVRRGELVLRAAALHQVDSLILGAWGCGVFRNDPHRVADAFWQWVCDEYRQHFRRVVFAVFDPTEKRENYKAFSKRFGN